MTRVLLLSTTTGYQTRMFGEAAERLGIELVFATDRCHQLDDPWRDAAIAVRFYDEDASLAAILAAARERPVDGILALGDRPTVLAARAAEALGLPGHPPDAARAASNKLVTRRRLTDAGLPAPWFRAAPVDADPDSLLGDVTFPCVVKPLALSASRGVIRADDPDGFRAAFERLRRLLRQLDVLAMRDPANDTILVEGFVEGREFALEGLFEHGRLHVLALFDKPDPLDGPFFEETIYVTPSSLPRANQQRLVDAVAGAAAALGLRHGPIHAECRVNPRGVVVLEVAARPIGGLCARALRFVDTQRGGFETRTTSLKAGATGDSETAGHLMPLEELLLRHAIGASVARVAREPAASAVMMIPIPREGIYRQVDGPDRAAAVPGVDEVRITAKPDERLVPLPEGASYLGFIFAHAATPGAAVAAIRAAHAELAFVIDAPIPVV